MADSANGKGGKAPRTLFSLGRSGGKRSKGSAVAASTLESYPPADPETSTAVAVDEGFVDVPMEEPPVVEAAVATDVDACPSCSSALVPGALFCGECGTKIEAAAAVVAPDAVVEDAVAPDAVVETPAHAEDTVADADVAPVDDEYVPAHAEPDPPEDLAAEQVEPEVVDEVDAEVVEPEVEAAVVEPEVVEPEVVDEVDAVVVEPDVEADEVEPEVVDEVEADEAGSDAADVLVADELIDADEFSEDGELEAAVVEPDLDPDDASGRGAFATFAGVAAATEVAEAVEAEVEPEVVGEAETTEVDTVEAEVEPEVVGEAETTEVDTGEAEVEPEVVGEAETTEVDTVEAAAALAEPDTETDTAAGTDTTAGEPEVVDDDADEAVPAAAAAAAGGAGVAYGVQTVDDDAPASSGGGKHTGLILVAAAVVIIALVAGVLVLGSGSSKKVNTATPRRTVLRHNDDTSTTGDPTTTLGTTTSTVADTPTTLAPTSTVANAAPTTPAPLQTIAPVRPVTQTTVGAPALVYKQSCSGGPGTGSVVLTNSGGQPGSYHVTGNNVHVLFNGGAAADGSVPPHQSVTIIISESPAHSFDGNLNIAMLLAGSGKSYCAVSV